MWCPCHGSPPSGPPPPPAPPVPALRIRSCLLQKALKSSLKTVGTVWAGVTGMTLYNAEASQPPLSLLLLFTSSS